MTVIERDATVATAPAPDTRAAARPAARPRAAETPATNGAPREVLTFRMGPEEYAIDILAVQEIRSYEEPLRLPDMPGAMRGVVNLRGVIVPILDLRLSFGLEHAALDAVTAVIVLSVAGKEVGVVVDSVNDVTEIAASQIQPSPRLGGAVETEHVDGIATLGEGASRRSIIVMNAERLLARTGVL